MDPVRKSYLQLLDQKLRLKVPNLYDESYLGTLCDYKDDPSAISYKLDLDRDEILEASAIFNNAFLIPSQPLESLPAKEHNLDDDFSPGEMYADIDNATKLFENQQVSQPHPFSLNGIKTCPKHAIKVVEDHLDDIYLIKVKKRDLSLTEDLDPDLVPFYEALNFFRYSDEGFGFLRPMYVSAMDRRYRSLISTPFYIHDGRYFQYFDEEIIANYVSYINLDRDHLCKWCYPSYFSLFTLAKAINYDPYDPNKIPVYVWNRFQKHVWIRGPAYDLGIEAMEYHFQKIRPKKMEEEYVKIIEEIYETVQDKDDHNEFQMKLLAYQRRIVKSYMTHVQNKK